MDAKKRSSLIIFVCCSILFCFAGCADNEYVDTTLGLTVQQLDGDLDDRWSTTGVVIKNIHAGKTSNQSKLMIEDFCGVLRHEKLPLFAYEKDLLYQAYIMEKSRLSNSKNKIIDIKEI